MNHGERRSMLSRYAFGLILLVLMYLLVTILRSVRADFTPEIWAGMQNEVSPAVYSWTEMIVAFLVLVCFGSMVKVVDNRRAFFMGLSLCCIGLIAVAVAAAGLQSGQLNPFAFMVLNGIGLYLPYIAVHTTIFERFIAMTRERGNIGYLMYLADSFGYLGYVAVLFLRPMLSARQDFLSFFLLLCWTIAGASLVLLIPSWRYFSRLTAESQPSSDAMGPVTHGAKS
jgi:hypothetical protein